VIVLVNALSPKENGAWEAPKRDPCSIQGHQYFTLCLRSNAQQQEQVTMPVAATLLRATGI